MTELVQIWDQNHGRLRTPWALKYWGEFMQTSRTRFEERLIPASQMTGCLLFAYKVAMEKNEELEQQLIEQAKDTGQLRADMIL